ncbi:MAG: hypothetical protein CL857_04985 [Cryomorphaceae bacterium]|nr:hypothetical protein [Cryomorphaceae bacterium]
MKTICPKECKLKMQDNPSLKVVDIREAFEYEFCNLGNVHIPMQDFLDNVDSLDKTKTYVLMCKSGNRASALANLLICEKGLNNILVMEGGIMGWKEKNDPSLNIE